MNEQDRAIVAEEARKRGLDPAVVVALVENEVAEGRVTDDASLAAFLDAQKGSASGSSQVAAAPPQQSQPQAQAPSDQSAPPYEGNETYYDTRAGTSSGAQQGQAAQTPQGGQQGQGGQGGQGGQASRIPALPVANGRISNPFGGTQGRAPGMTGPLPSTNVGVDIAGKYGDPVVLPKGVSGVVVAVYDARSERDVNENSGYGGSIVVRGDDGYLHRFSHLRPGSLQVRPGQRVGEGTPLAQVGHSGNTDDGKGGPFDHVDWEKQDASTKQHVDPVSTAGQLSADAQKTPEGLRRAQADYDGANAEHTQARQELEALETRRAQLQAKVANGTASDQEGIEYQGIDREVARLTAVERDAYGRVTRAAAALRTSGQPAPVKNFGTSKAPDWRYYDSASGQWLPATGVGVPGAQGGTGTTGSTTPANVPTNTTEPYIVTRVPDGKGGYTLQKEPNPNYIAPKPDKPTTFKGEDGLQYVLSADGKSATPVSGVGKPIKTITDPKTGGVYIQNEDGTRGAVVIEPAPTTTTQDGRLVAYDPRTGQIVYTTDLLGENARATSDAELEAKRLIAEHTAGRTRLANRLIQEGVPASEIEKQLEAYDRPYLTEAQRIARQSEERQRISAEKAQAIADSQERRQIQTQAMDVSERVTLGAMLSNGGPVRPGTATLNLPNVPGDPNESIGVRILRQKGIWRDDFMGTKPPTTAAATTTSGSTQVAAVPPGQGGVTAPPAGQAGQTGQAALAGETVPAPAQEGVAAAGGVQAPPAPAAPAATPGFTGPERAPFSDEGHAGMAGGPPMRVPVPGQEALDQGNGMARTIYTDGSFEDWEIPNAGNDDQDDEDEAGGGGYAPWMPGMGVRAPALKKKRHPARRGSGHGNRGITAPLPARAAA